MELRERIEELKAAIAEAHSASDWRQRVAHPEEDEAEGWGTSDVIAPSRVTGKWEKVARVFDSGNLRLVVTMRRHIEALIAELEARC